MGRAVCVIWHDAHAGSETWIHLDADQDNEPYIVTSIGFLLDPKRGGKPNHTSIAQSWSADDAVDSVLHIPDAMVKRIYDLRGKRHGLKDGFEQTSEKGRRKDR